METNEAVTALAALAHPGRLAAYRRLVHAGPSGLSAGDLARALAMPPSSLTTALTQLAAADLVASERDGRSIVYRARFDQMGRLLGYLADDCCGGAQEVCAPVARAAARARCA